MGRFINPFTDFGFKFLFGREVEKELFRLDAVYGVFFMNFVMDKDMPATIRTDVVLSDRGYRKALEWQVSANLYRIAKL